MSFYVSCLKAKDLNFHLDISAINKKIDDSLCIDIAIRVDELGISSRC
jgi:hypothetical protein